MLPFLATDLGLLVKSLMARFVKHNVIDSCKSVASLTKVEFEKTANHMDSSKFDVGFCAKTTLRSKNISDQNRHVFRLECRDMLVAILQKIMSKAPINRSLVRSLSWLDPRLLPKISESEIVRRIDNLDVTLRHMVDARKMQPSQCDAVRTEYRAACENIAGGGSTAEYENFSPSVHRLDKLLFPVLGTNAKYASLWSLVKQILILSHGQATVERGFSINKETATDNLSEKKFDGSPTDN